MIVSEQDKMELPPPDVHESWNQREDSLYREDSPMQVQSEAITHQAIILIATLVCVRESDILPLGVVNCVCICLMDRSAR